MSFLALLFHTALPAAGYGHLARHGQHVATTAVTLDSAKPLAIGTSDAASACDFCRALLHGKHFAARAVDEVVSETLAIAADAPTRATVRAADRHASAAPRGPPAL